MARLRTMLALISVIFTVLMTGCATEYKVEKREKEDIIALALDDTHLYVMGRRSYQFPRQNIPALEKIINSPYAKKMNYIEATGRVYASDSIAASLEMIISPDRLTEAQQQDLTQHYGFVHLKNIPDTSVYWKNTALSSSLRITPALLRRYYVFRGGSIVEIENKQSFLDKYPLSKPIAMNLEYYTTGRGIDGESAATAVAAPLFMVTAIPVFLIWGAVCSNHGC